MRNEQHKNQENNPNRQDQEKNPTRHAAGTQKPSHHQEQRQGQKPNQPGQKPNQPGQKPNQSNPGSRPNNR